MRRARYDYVLVWGHGIRYIDEILAAIRWHSALKIVKIVNHVPHSVEDLVEVIYSYDYAPIEHLRGKTEYLKGTPNEVYFIFVENREPGEDFFGEGPYRHIESRTLKQLKERIRDRFNPRVDGGRSEDHVVHASDNMLQTEYILRHLGLGGVGLFARRHLALDAPYHLREISDFTIRAIPLDSLQCRIVAGGREVYVPRRVSGIEATPHYRALVGDLQAYRDYVATFRGQALTDDHCLESFLRLKDSLRYLAPPFESAYLVVEETSTGELVLLDGVHRAAILKYQGVIDLHVAVVDGGCHDAGHSDFL